MTRSSDNAQPPTATWCVIPWVHLFANEEGQHRPCCMALEDGSMANRKENGEPYVIDDPAGIDEAWNSTFMRSIRRDMMAGEQPKPCRRCFRDEDLGLHSYREMSNTIFRHHIAEAVASTSEDGTSPSELIRSVDLRLGNLCNLRCRMCSPISSKALIPEFAELYGLSEDHARLKNLRNLDWFSRDTLWRSFEKYAPQIERLHFAGGEPMLIPEMFDFLERLIASGHAADITLSYVTNLTVFPKKVFALWPRFKRVSVVVSLDGVGGVNSFIRYPSSWSVIDRNLRALDSAAQALNCTDGLTFNVTVQAYNIFRMDELLEYAALTFQHVGRPKLSLLYYPEHFSIQILPAEMKRAAAARLQKFIERFAPRWPSRWPRKELDELLSSLSGIVDHMMGVDRTDLLPEFRRWTRHMDSVRRQHMATAIPELASLV